MSAVPVKDADPAAATRSVGRHFHREAMRPLCPVRAKVIGAPGDGNHFPKNDRRARSTERDESEDHGFVTIHDVGELAHQLSAYTVDDP